MKWIIKKLIKLFFNSYYKVKPPESVRYYKKSNAARARLMNAKDGSLQMEIQGEKYPFAGFPRGHVLMGPLAGLKKKLKDLVFNQVFEEIDKMYDTIKTDALPVERCCPAVRELNRVLQRLEDAEVTEDMKGRIRLIKKVLTFFLQEDDAYRFRWQWVMERLDISKIKLSKGDKYYFRGKYFKVDHDKWDY
jgi:hypothetical protein